MISHRQAINRARTALINRLHALYAHAGHTTLKKRNMATPESRKAVRDLLENACDHEMAASLERQMETVEGERDRFREKINAIVSDSELSPYVLSIPGVGPSLAVAFLACVGDGSRFGKAGGGARLIWLFFFPNNAMVDP